MLSILVVVSGENMNLLNVTKGDKVPWAYFLGLWLCSMLGLAVVIVGLVFPNRNPERTYDNEIFVGEYKYFSSYSSTSYYGLYKYKIGSGEEPVKLSGYSMTSYKYLVEDKIIYNPHRARGICIVDLKSEAVTLLEGRLTGPVVLDGRVFFVNAEKKRLMEYDLSKQTTTIVFDEPYMGCRKSDDLLVLRNERGEDFFCDLVDDEIKIVR